MTSQIWDAGTITVTNGSTLATGTGGTGWLTAAVRYGTVEIGNRQALIASVEGEGAMTFARPWSGPNYTGPYAILRRDSAAADMVAIYDKFSASIIRHALTALQPRGAGDLTKRDALVLTDDDDGFVWLHAEDANVNDWQYYVWQGVVDGWVGPQAVFIPGEDGNPGDPGPAGDGFNPVGAWLISTLYDKNDMVTFGGRSFVSKVDDNTGNQPPSADEDDANWMFVPAAKGDPGTPIELQTTATHIQWRYEGDPTWTDLVALADISGEDGAAATIAAGTVTMVANADPATVSNSGTTSAAVFDFEIPSPLDGQDGISFIWRGAYSGATAYAKDDVARDQGSSWIALQATTGNAPPTLPTTSNSYWELMSQRGQDGAGAGSVTSVALSAPTGFSVSGSPVTTSGTLTLAYAAGYQGFLTAQSTKVNFLTVTAATDLDAMRTKLAGIANGATANTGTVTSVGVTVPTGFSVSGSPVTTSGTFAITYAAGYQGYTSAEASKLSGIASGATANTGTVTSVGLSLPTGLSVSGSPITTSGSFTVTYSAGYQGYTSAEASKLSGIASGAQVNLATATFGEFNSATSSRSLGNESVWSSLAVLTDGTNIAVDFNNGYDFGGTSNAALALGGNRTLSAPTNVRNGKKGILWFGAATSTRTLTLDAAWVLCTGVEVGPYSITTAQTLGVAYVCRGTTVYVTGILRNG